MGILLVSDLTLYFLALALLGGVLFMLTALRLRQLEDRIARIHRDLRGETDRAQRFEELAARLVEALDARRSGDEDAGGLVESIRGELHAEIATMSSTLDEQLSILRGAMRSTLQEELQSIHAPRLHLGDQTPEMRVADFLGSEGFQRVVVLSEEGDPEDPDLARLAVEAVREDVVHKGVVTVHGGEVVDVELRPTYPMFP